MASEKLVKVLIIFSLGTVGGIFSVMPEEPVLIDAPFNYFDVALPIYAISWLVSLFLLFKFHPSGRSFFTVILALGVPITLGITESKLATSNMYDMLFWLSGMIDGALLAILYLTNIKERFNKFI
ncbi:hypothetical protein OAT13_01515 [Gammaproteobacteria bacterium]|nr:hypothetical protein [Gammaproteobacteria bacterium]